MGSKYSELQIEAIKHWRDNLRKIRRLNWYVWIIMDRDDRVRCCHGAEDDIYPCTYGNGCPYCQVFAPSCIGCPLLDTNADIDCCTAWWEAMKAIVLSPVTKRSAIKACKAMIKYIKRRGYVSEDRIRGNM